MACRITPIGITPLGITSSTGRNVHRGELFPATGVMPRPRRYAVWRYASGHRWLVSGRCPGLHRQRYPEQRAPAALAADADAAAEALDLGLHEIHADAAARMPGHRLFGCEA